MPDNGDIHGNVKSGERVVNGYLRSAMANDPEFFEVSATPEGERVRYISEDVDSLTVMENLRYIKRKCRGTGVSSAPKIRWICFRQPYVQVLRQYRLLRTRYSRSAELK